MKKRFLLFSVLSGFLMLSSCGQSAQFNLDNNLGVCRSLEDARVALEAGANYMEINIQQYLVPEQGDEVFAKSVEAFKASPLPVYAGNCFFPGDLKIIGPNADTPRAIAYAEKALERAGALGMRILVLGSGGAREFPEDFDRDEADRQMIALLTAIAPSAQKYGVTIVIEPLNTSETRYINTVREGYEICKKVNHPNICVLADFFHMYKMGEGPDALVEAASKLRHCHIAEGEHRTPPGVERDDFSGYFKALKSVGYQGALSLECDWGEYELTVKPAIDYTKEQINNVK